jgi:hypothetical protein
MDERNDTFSYKGWLISDNFLKRAMAVVGYQFIGTIVLYLLLVAAVFIIAFIVGFVGSLM